MRMIGVHLKNRSGFTLIELLVVLFILGALSAIAVPMYLGQRTKAMITEAESNLDILRLLEEQYYAENGNYAPSPDGSAFYNSTYNTLDSPHNGLSLYNSLPGFKPGDPDNLKFDYTVTTSNSGEDFVARAQGKGNTPVENSCFQIDQDNVFDSCP